MEKQRYQLGEEVAIIGTIHHVEMTPEGRIFYYMREAPEVPILEKDMWRTTATELDHEYKAITR